MRKLNKKKVAVIVLLAIIIIIEILALGLSRAEKIKEMTLSARDYENNIQTYTIAINAFDGGESGYYILLPEMIDNKQVAKYMVEEKSITQISETPADIVENTTIENTIETAQEVINTVEKIPGDKLFVTTEELENAQISVQVVYDTKEVEGNKLYNIMVTADIGNDNTISIQGYMPIGTSIELAEITEELTNIFTKANTDEEFSLKQIFSAKLMNNDVEYVINENEDTFQVKISGVNNAKRYKILQLDEEENAQELTDITVAENNLNFIINTLNTFAVFEDNTIIEEQNTIAITDTMENLDSLALDSAVMLLQSSPMLASTYANLWDGTVSTGFKFGNGTQSNPYLISNGEELAYLAEQVNSGNTYEGTYFQLISDIDLDGKVWTPIGTYTNSFRGIFDGLGHTISNAKINIPSLATSVTSYGMFGSIGGGSSSTEIRNVEFNNINITITANGTTSNNNTEKGYNIGIVTGTMFRNSSVKNVIVKASSITDTNTVTLRNSRYQVLVGGIAGDARYSSTSTTDPGSGSRYSIDNCYVSANIDLDVALRWNTLSYAAQYHTGGIIGRIRSQPVWPTNCLFAGTINSNGFIGPIFGALRNNTGLNTNNFATLWNGNDSGNLTMTSYYTNYAANGTTFTSNQTSGTSTSRVSTNGIGAVQGVNKGLYTNDKSSRLNSFNANAGGDYVSWKYENSELSLIPRLTATAQEIQTNIYQIQVNDPYNIGNYTYKWYINGELDNTITGNTSPELTPTFETGYDVLVIVSAGNYYTAVSFEIPKLYIDIEFAINETNDSVTAHLVGTALPYANIADYTFTWYSEDITGTVTEIENGNSLTLNNIEKGVEYRLVATNNVDSRLSAENSFMYGNRIVVFVDYYYGSDYNDGFTPETAVETLETAYSKLSSTGTRNENVIVMMENYTDSYLDFFNSQTSTTYAKKATITGKYGGVDYNPVWRFGSSNSGYYFRYLTQDLTIMHLDLNGGNGYMYLVCQGHSFTVGEDVTMVNYRNANENQGLLGNNAPGFHVFAGWYQYNRTSLPNNNCEIVIKSGTYGRIVLGGTPGTSSGQGQTTSHDFIGSPNEYFNVSVLIDIKNSTTASNYDYDVNLLVGGSACGNNYSIVTENIVSGSVGRVCGGSIGDSATRPNRWNYPENTFMGETTINISGGTVSELYGGCLGRNMDVVGSSTAPGNTCDSYFYGTVNINMTGGAITGNIYGAGAGGVTGYSENSSDPYKSYGASFDTNVNINISNGTVGGNIYGGGYGYTEYLNANVTAVDGGALYGNSNITISGSPTINGNIYAAGCGEDLSSKPNIAQMTGDSNINISGTPTINGQIYGAGAGLQGYAEMAKLTGKSTINIAANLSSEVFGGGNIAKTTGTTYININNGTHTGNIYGGGNVGIVDGTANVTINGGTQTRVFGGGNEAETTTTNVYIKGGNSSEVYGGGNLASVTTTNVYLQGGTADNIFAGSNQSGDVQSSNLTTTSGTATNIYGGNNQGGTVTNSYVTINGGNITNAYGGNNAGGTTTTSEVRVKNGELQNVFGGGNEAETTTSNVYVEGGRIVSTYGGGNLASVTTTNVYLQGGTSDNIFAGSNQSGNVEKANLTTSSGTATNVYGGNNQGGTVTSSYVTLNGGAITNAYGGNNAGGTTTTSEVRLKSGNVGNIFGGGNQATGTTSNVYIEQGSASNVYGGGNQAGLQTANVNLMGGDIQNVFGGSNRSGDVQESNILTISNTAESSPVRMTVSYDVSAAESWQSTTYPTYAKLYVTLSNTTANSVDEWRAKIIAPDSTIYANYTNTDIVESNGTYSFDQVNRYYGINSIPAGGTYSFEFEILSMKSVDEFTVETAFTGTDTEGNSYGVVNINVGNIYGGNNEGGTTVNPNIEITGGTIGNIYGGGNRASVPTTNVQIKNGKIQNVYGGGNAAKVDTNTNLVITGGTIENNIYGGGNEGVVDGNTYVRISNATIKGSAYAGGNGATAVVNGNTNINIEGNTIVGSEENAVSPHTGSVFGGGNAAPTGTQGVNNSTSTVNIVGATIYGNVYGGANTSVVYGYTKLNIGYEAVQNTDLRKSDIYIRGTVFGGGEANAAGSEEYDFSFISVTRGIEIKIDGNGHTNFKTEGSIFGSGNASSTSGESYITIKDYGTVDAPCKNISIQRATTVTLDNSAIVLSGTTDRTNEYSTVKFTLSRVDELKLKNNSTLYLNCGANLLKNLKSLVDVNGTETVAAVQIDEETGATVRNVDNRIYLYEGKNLNIATNEQVTAYGEVTGMTFLGLYTNTNNPSTSTGLYNHNFNNGDEITNAGTFSLNSYVLGMHKANHDIEVDGFYTNYNNEGYIKSGYVEVTPEDDLYYIWLVGEKLDVKTFEISLTASKYATLGTYELSLTGYATPNTKFQIVGFAAGLESGISLVNGSQIEAIAPDNTTADSVFGLSMKSGKNGWQTNNTTNFYTADGGRYDGPSLYAADNSTYTPSLTFCLYHSQNLTVAQDLGSVRVRFQVMVPIDDLTYDISYIDIVINMSAALFQDNYYEAAISPGEEFDLFTTTETSITNESIFSTYYSLLITDFSENEYNDDYPTCKRVLVSRDASNMPYVYKQNTRIIMLDMATNKYYYYIVTAEDETNNVYMYELNKFIEMGSTNAPYKESDAYNLYHDSTQDLIYENFIFHVDVSESNITADAINNSLLIELQDSSGNTLIGVLGIQRDTTQYSIYTNKTATIDVSATCQDTIYLGDTINLNVTTDFKQSVINSKMIFDTKYFSSKMGIKISIYDSNGNQLNSDSLLGINFTYEGQTYYPRIDGSTRIKIADRVSNVLSKIKINTERNTTLATGDYTIKVETFGSPDGIYYGLQTSDYAEKQITIINGAYGLKVTTDDDSKIVDKTTGKVLNGNNSIVAVVDYSSALTAPNLVVELQRRTYDTEYSTQYETVNFADYFTNTYTAGYKPNEYFVIDNPANRNTIFLYFKENLVTGTYKLVFKLYDDNNYIGEAYEYFIVK